MDRLRIVILAPDPLARAGLAAIFERQDGCQVVGAAAGLADLPAALDLYRPDVGLVDLGVDFFQQPDVLDRPAALPLVYLVPPGVPGAARPPFPVNPVQDASAGSNEPAPRMGRAILARDANPDVIVHAFHLVLAGLRVQDPRVDPREMRSREMRSRADETPFSGEGYPDQGTEATALNRLPGEEARFAALDASAYDPLTARELEVLGLIAEGLPNKRVAQRLGISEHTVKYHINAILSKLGAESRTEAVTRAARLGWIIL